MERRPDSTAVQLYSSIQLQLDIYTPRLIDCLSKQGTQSTMKQVIRLLPFVASCVYSLPMQGLDGTLSVEIPGASWALLQDSQIVHSLEQQLVQTWCEGVECSVSIEAADSSRRAMQTGNSATLQVTYSIQCGNNCDTVAAAITTFDISDANSIISAVRVPLLQLVSLRPRLEAQQQIFLRRFRHLPTFKSPCH